MGGGAGVDEVLVPRTPPTSPVTPERRLGCSGSLEDMVVGSRGRMVRRFGWGPLVRFSSMDVQLTTDAETGRVI